MIQGHGEHASRRFHFVREDYALRTTHYALSPYDSQIQYQPTALSACESDWQLHLTESQLCACSRILSNRGHRADGALACIRLRCVTSLYSIDKSSSPLRLSPPYPLPLSRCIQARLSRVGSIEMTTSVAGVQQPGKSPIGAIAERTHNQLHMHLLCHGLQHQFHSHTPCQIHS